MSRILSDSPHRSADSRYGWFERTDLDTEVVRIIQSDSDGCLIHLDRKVVGVDEKLCSWLGWEGADLIGAPLHQLLDLRSAPTRTNPMTPRFGTVYDARGRATRVRALEAPIWSRKTVARLVALKRDSDEPVASVSPGAADLRFIVDHVSDIVWRIDLSGNLQYCNPAVAVHRGFRAEEMPGRLDQRLPPAALEAFQQAIQGLLDEATARPGHPPRPVTLELEQYRKDGGTWSSIVTARLVLDDAGKPIAVMGISRDADSLQRGKGPAPSTPPTGDMIALGIAHDLGNLLTAILGHVSLARRHDGEFTLSLADLECACSRASSCVPSSWPKWEAGAHGALK